MWRSGASRRCLEDQTTAGRPDEPRLYRDIDAQHWRDLFDPAMLDDLIHGTALRRPYFYLVKEGARIPINRYTRAVSLLGGSVGGVAEPESLYREMAEGATLVMLNLEHLLGPLRRFCAALSAEFGEPVDIGAYITPPNSKALPTHFDHQDVMILQCHGSKQWSVYERTAHSPTLGQQVSVNPASQVLSATLRAGTSLYIPAGTPHRAETSDDLSIHLTVGITPVRRRDLLKVALESLLGNPELDAPASLDESPAGSRQTEWIDECAERLRAARAPRDQFVSPRPDSRRFADLTGASRCRSLVWLAPSKDVDVVWDDDGAVELAGDGWDVQLTGSASELVHLLLDGRCVEQAAFDKLADADRSSITQLILRGLIAADEQNR